MIMFFCSLAVVMAQNTVSGKVTDGTGEGLPGVNVVIKGTTTGAVTDFDGNYQLSVDDGTTLVFSYVGFETQEIEVGSRTNIDIVLSGETELEEVVVTAQGIQREKKALGYAATTIGGSDVNTKPETDIGRALQGRTPGLQILTTSGLAGSGTKINIRGTSSVTGNTQPLWIVDGVPVNTGTNELTPSAQFYDGQISPTRFLDIDPNNIEAISVLRGLSATTLYGSLGRNGVILITTKSGSGKSKDRFYGSISESHYINEAILPQYQNKWSNGFDGDYGEFFSNWGRLFEYTTSPNGGSRHPFYEWRDVFPEFPEFQSKDDYVPRAYPDNVKGVFRNGSVNNVAVNFGLSGEVANVNFSYSNLSEEGFIDNNELQRNNFSLGTNVQLLDKLSFKGVFNFVRTDFQTPPVGGSGGSNTYGGPSLWANLFYTPRNLNLAEWPYEHPVTGANVYYRGITNPRWILNNARQESVTNRFFSSSSLTYDITDWLNVTYRLGYDTYSEDQAYWVHKGSVGYSSGFGSLPYGTGLYRSSTGINTIVDQTVILGVNRELTSDLDVSASLGYNYRKDSYVQTGLESTGQIIFGLVEHRNFEVARPSTLRDINLNYSSERIWIGAFFDVGLGYQDWLFLNLSGRNDWTSTHEKENRAIFYPAASVSFVPTTLFPDMATEVLDLLKIRIGYGTSANFVGPYNTRPALILEPNLTEDALGSVVALRNSRSLANPNIKPELLSELEFGVEASLFRNRGTLEFSYYDKTATNQIINRSLDPATGYTSTNINAGIISNKGIEVGFSFTPISKEITWTIGGQYTSNRPLVEELPEGSKEINLSGFTNLGNFAVEGQPFNLMYGRTTARDPVTGRRLIDKNGDYKVTSEIEVIGNPNPDWLGSLINTVSWKGLSLNVHVDYVQGGDIYSLTAAQLVGRGVAKELEDFDPELPIVLPGLKENAEGELVENDIPQTTSGGFFGNTILGGPAEDRGVFDATRVRLREVSLSYNVPKSLYTQTFLKDFKGISITLIGQNLWFRAINAPKYSAADFDRTSFGTGNGAGFDFSGGPSSRRYGATLKLNF